MPSYCTVCGKRTSRLEYTVCLEHREPPHKPRRVTARRLADFPPGTPQPTPCRLWQGAVDGKGYGRRPAPINGTRIITRWVMSVVLGRPLHPSEVVMHLCDNPPCYRFDHLRLGTLADNNADMVAKGRDRWRRAT